MNDDWLQLQQKYWEQWSDVSRKALGMDTGGTGPVPGFYGKDAGAGQDVLPHGGQLHS